MKKTFYRPLAYIFFALVLIILLGCATPGDTVTEKAQGNAGNTQVIPVTRGDLVISVTVDGNLVMPQAFDLRFGAPGIVEEVLVEEGDLVREGTVMARLNNTNQQLDLKAANCSLQQTLSNMYEIIPAAQQTFGYPSFYPNSSAKLASTWAKEEIASALELIVGGYDDAAASELHLAAKDMNAIAHIFRDAIENPNAGLGDTRYFDRRDETNSWMQYYPSDRLTLVQQWQDIINQVMRAQTDLDTACQYLAAGDRLKSTALVNRLASESAKINMRVVDNVNRVRVIEMDMTYPARGLCQYFYRQADSMLAAALLLIDEGQANSPGYLENLRSAQHYMEICNSLLGSSVVVLEHGYSLSSGQQYNFNLSKSAVALENRKDDVLKTVIIAPFDGTVVSVGVKKNDILSGMDYSSKSGVQLVDTNAVKFEGLVDEIDILKIKSGQKASITVDALQNQIFSGTVTFISPYGGAAGTTSVVKFAITIQIDTTDIELKGGLTSTAEVAIETFEDMLMLPISAVSTTPDGSFVNVVVDEPSGKTEKRAVILGGRNQQFVAILSGLNEGDKISFETQTGGSPVISGFGPPPGGGGPPPR